MIDLRLFSYSIRTLLLKSILSPLKYYCESPVTFPFLISVASYIKWLMLILSNVRYKIWINWNLTRFLSAVDWFKNSWTWKSMQANGERVWFSWRRNLKGVDEIYWLVLLDITTYDLRLRFYFKLFNFNAWEFCLLSHYVCVVNKLLGVSKQLLLLRKLFMLHI